MVRRTSRTKSNKRSKIKWLGVAALILLTACGPSTNVQPGDRDYPGKNPDPKKFMLLHGTIDNSLDLKFTVTWHAANDGCRYYTSRIEGATNNYFASEPLSLERNGDNFSAKVYIDGVLPGRCGWVFGGIGMSGQSGFGKSLVQTNTDPATLGRSPNGVINLRCQPAMRTGPPLVPELHCAWVEPEDRNASVRGGVLWWRPQTTDVEVHVRRGTCRLAGCADSD
jgi:hypothetical protein